MTENTVPATPIIEPPIAVRIARAPSGRLAATKKLPSSQSGPIQRSSDVEKKAIRSAPSAITAGTNQ